MRYDYHFYYGNPSHLAIDVNALRSKERVWKFKGNSYDTLGRPICESKWSAMIMDKENE